jgi:hypothetical protein
MNADRIVGTVSERHAQLDAALNTKESAQHSLQQLKAEIAAILDIYDSTPIFSDKVIKHVGNNYERLRQLSAV